MESLQALERAIAEDFQLGDVSDSRVALAAHWTLVRVLQSVAAISEEQYLPAASVAAIVSALGRSASDVYQILDENEVADKAAPPEHIMAGYGAVTRADEEAQRVRQARVKFNATRGD